jgi:hypothetical protein
VDELTAFVEAGLRSDAAYAGDDPCDCRPAVGEPCRNVPSCPDRVRRDVTAKRAIIARYEQQAAKQGENAMEEDRAWTLEPVLALLAVSYAGRPGYKEKWRPATDPAAGPGLPPASADH